MHASFTVGRIAGIEVGINWSWIVVVALITWSLAAGVFPETNPGLSDGTYVAMAVVASALFFTSLFLHEMGHAVRAQREGMEIAGITLWLFGGVAQFKGMFPSAGAEFRIAIAGPLVSLAIGLVFLAAALVLPLPAAVDGVVFWLGYINLFLLAFNMLPALPLDGGRVLRSILWQVKGDFAAATRTAAALGRGFGQLLIFGGLLMVIAGGTIGGVWLAFIGWFLLGAAEAEARWVLARTALAGVRVGDVMVRDPVVTDPDMTVAAFMDDVFFAHRHTAYPVVRAGSALGIVSFRQAAAVPREEWPVRSVKEVMVPVAGALVVRESDALADVLPQLMTAELSRALVCEGDELRGILSITDATRVLEVRERRLPQVAGRPAANSPA